MATQRTDQTYETDQTDQSRQAAQGVSEVEDDGHGLPGAGLAVEKMPGHWLLARLGKRVLRPGGKALTAQMLEELGIGAADDVVEFAPGLGVTARETLARGPRSYVGVERDQVAAAMVRGYLRGDAQRCVIGSAERTGLADGCASAVYGEAMLTMQPPKCKAKIIAEAWRLLRPGGRYGVHELSLAPEDIAAPLKAEVGEALSKAIRVGARPLTGGEWRALLEAHGFEVRAVHTAPMHLLEPARLVADEGWRGAARIALNVLRDAQARARVLEMRGVFRRYAQHLGAVALVAVKPHTR